MNIVTSASDSEFSSYLYSAYKQKPGSRAIASKFALTYLSAILRQFKPNNAIEFGAGIGTITHALLAHSVRIEEVISTETNTFCLEQLNLNIPEDLTSRLKIVENQKELAGLQKTTDLVIFDGGSVNEDEMAFLGEGSVCFIEGNRLRTATKVNEVLKKSGLNCDFQNYIQGYRYFYFIWKHSKKSGRKRLKFRFKHPKKGFRVGQVRQL